MTPRTPNDRTTEDCLIVGVGASAGGLAAFKTLFSLLPADSAMAFVLVQHLAPQHNSMLVDLLRPHSAMPIVEAEDGMPVSRNHVYVIPPDATLTIAGRVLRVARPAPARAQRRPIDTFFCSLAEQQGECAVAVVLSGVGSDGSLGVRAIKEHGGFTLAQAEIDHQAMSGMPLSAAATGLVDHVVPIEEMPEKLLAYRRHLEEVASRKDGEGVRQDTRDHLVELAALLRARTGHDFRGYKEGTLARRVQRRMQVRHLDSVASYLELLRSDPVELDNLFGDLLISVTEFFRNPEAFDALAANVIPKILAGKGPDDPVRIWVPGCATGEEVYTIAIIMREAMSARDRRIVIFGTDIDAPAIAVARASKFGKQPFGLSAERFDRWFVKDGDHYCPIKEVRDLCVFSVHSVIKDPPFSRLDLISCRNLLIYLNNDVQHRVMETFHYSLNPEGYLFLGPSESATRDAKLFTVIDKKRRILQRRDVSASIPKFSIAAAGPTLPMAPQAKMADDGVDKRARRVLEPFSPAYFVIDGRDEIIRFSGPGTGHYLEPSSGAASLSLFAILKRNLRQPVRAALEEAREHHRSVVQHGLNVRIDGRTRAATLIVEPVGETREAGTCVVAFREIVSEALSESAVSVAPGDANVQALELELRDTQAQLQDAINDLELHIEEAKSASEEYQSVNEELQSSNEELETAKEEMQSLNEELQTVNAELFSKNDMLTRLNSDIHNLMDSTEIAIVFLDQNLRVKNFTPAIADIFPLQEGDRGRPLSHIVSRLIDTDLTDDLITVQRSHVIVEREMQIQKNGQVSTLLMRARPYRTVNNRIDGIVVTFVDINALTEVNAERARFAALAKASGDAIIGLSLTGTISSWSPGAATLLGYSPEEMIGRNISTLEPLGSEAEHTNMLARIQRGEEVPPYDTLRQHKNGTLIPVSLRAAPILSQHRIPIGISSTLRDITLRKRSERLEVLLNRELSHRVKNSLAVIQSIATHTLRSTPDPERFSRAFQGRLQALATAHELLTRENWSGAGFSELATQQLAPFLSDDPQRLQLDGPKVQLPPEIATSLGLVLHELATNASKYGSLSVPTGSVLLSWSLDGDVEPPRLHVTWQELGGPTVCVPKRRGFGSQLIKRIGVTVNHDYQPDGLICTFAILIFVKPDGLTDTI